LARACSVREPDFRLLHQTRLLIASSSKHHCSSVNACSKHACTCMPWSNSKSQHHQHPVRAPLPSRVSLSWPWKGYTNGRSKQLLRAKFPQFPPSPALPRSTWSAPLRGVRSGPARPSPPLASTGP